MGRVRVKMHFCDFARAQVPAPTPQLPARSRSLPNPNDTPNVTPITWHAIYDQTSAIDGMPSLAETDRPLQMIKFSVTFHERCCTVDDLAEDELPCTDALTAHLSYSTHIPGVLLMRWPRPPTQCSQTTPPARSSPPSPHRAPRSGTPARSQTSCARM